MKKYFVFVFLVFSNLYLFGQTDESRITQAKIDVVYLASDYLEGRSTGKPGEAKAAEYIIHRFKELGLSPKGDEGSYLQEFSFKELPHPHADQSELKNQPLITARNVIGYLDKNQKYTVVVGGHYDHLGYGDSGSRTPDDKNIHNGADDNASGIAGLFAIAEKLNSKEELPVNILFIAFSGEEKGLFGSKYYADHPTIEIGLTSHMINMDMIGRLNENKTLVINGSGTSPVWKDLLPKLNKEFVLKLNESGIGPSDHTSFYLKNIPAIHFFTGQHKEYHKPSDDSHLVNYEGIIEIADYIVEIIENVGSDKLEFAKTKEDQSRRAAKYKVSLGVMPDYTSTEEGMRVDDVLDGRAAMKAGIEAGDVILKIGDMQIKNIYDYMEGLSKFSAGDQTKVIVKRGEVRKEVTVTF